MLIWNTHRESTAFTMAPLSLEKDTCIFTMTRRGTHEKVHANEENEHISSSSSICTSFFDHTTISYIGFEGTAAGEASLNGQRQHRVNTKPLQRKPSRGQQLFSRAPQNTTTAVVVVSIAVLLYHCLKVTCMAAW